MGQGIQSGLGVYAKQMNDYQQALGDVMQADYQAAQLKQRFEEGNLDRSQQAAIANLTASTSTANNQADITAEDKRLDKTIAAQKELAGMKGSGGAAAARAVKAAQASATEIAKAVTALIDQPTPEDFYKIYNVELQKQLQAYGLVGGGPDEAVDIADE